RSTTTRPNMVVNNGPHNKYVNLVVHDGGIGFYTYAATATDIEVTGGVFFNNGWQGTTEGGGHALYLKADVGPLVARDNIEFNQFGYGTQVYSNLGDGHLNNITLDGNVAFNNGALSTQYNSSGNANLLIGGQEAAQQCALLNNM